MIWSITRPQAQSSEAPKKRRSEGSFKSQGYHCGFEVSLVCTASPRQTRAVLQDSGSTSKQATLSVFKRMKVFLFIKLLKIHSGSFFRAVRVWFNYYSSFRNPSQRSSGWKWDWAAKQISTVTVPHKNTYSLWSTALRKWCWIWVSWRQEQAAARIFYVLFYKPTEWIAAIILSFCCRIW